ncbi:MAG TPA: FtsX-like permease family protein [Hyphomicrobiaceae bacterium]|nr:FtsX-like permease family protein [Hyphomicrobiaceae bacterium]
MARDLWAMRTQVLSIALLIAAGIAVFVMSVSNYFALVGAMDAHYRNERFADLFASVKRAPVSLAERIREIDGAGMVEPRVSQAVRVVREDSELPISGRIISIPSSDQPLLNRLYLTGGRWVDPTQPDEVIINAAYAEARGVRPGDAIDVVLSGRLESFRVAGVALSPEFVFATRSALPLPDDRNFVILWASQEVVAAAFDMKGAFNDLVMTLAPGANKAAVVEEIDSLLAPYGGIGAYDRRELPSNRLLEDELAEQETLSIVMPAIFFGIAAFLLHVVLGRLVEAQREQIASLKALGFSKLPIALHYFKFVTAIALLGAGIGLVLGRWFAVVVIDSYRAFFRFPVLEASLDPWIAAVSVLAAILVANAAAAVAVYRIASLPPAEAMRPQVPAVTALARHIGAMSESGIPMSYLMALRTIVGRPIRTLLTISGIALAVPLVLFGLFWFDAITHMIDVAFGRIERGDAFVTFSTPVSARALYELKSVPGVMLAEGQRIVPVRLVAGHRTYRTSLVGLSDNSELKVLRDPALAPIEIPPDGLMLSRALAETLDLHIGDSVTVEVQEAKRPVLHLPVVKLSEDILGFSATMDLAALNRLLREDDLVNAAALKLDPTASHLTWQRIQAKPKIEASSVKALWLTLFDETIAGMLVVGALILAGFGLLIAVGVVYNSARVAFQERAWELASLRILGFTRAEVALILLSELVFELIVAIPIGLLVGYGLIKMIVSLRIRESFQVPVVIEPASYAIAALVVLAAAAASAFVVRRRIDTLDLVSVLKTRD